MHCTKKLFWVENISNLFCDFDLVPMKAMTTEEQMNCLTRVVLLIFLFLFVLDYRYDCLFLGIALMLVIVLYYTLRSLKHKPTIEGYDRPLKRSPVPVPLPPPPSSPPSQPFFSGREIPIEQTISMNQRLVGPPNPKTLVQPVIPSPAYDFQTWAPNDFMVPSYLNEDRRQELHQNGYTTRDDLFSQENYSGGGCGYYPTNPQYGLPPNYNAPSCERSAAVAAYNRDVRTIPLQPGLSTYSEMNQPYASMSNLGISADPSFLPTTYDNGMFTEHNPATYIPPRPRYIPPEYPLRNEIYDPRYTGYGANYRQYIDPMVGQPRFFYDDITSQTQPNYITRNNIDMMDFAPRIGPAQDLGTGYHHMEIRERANRAYTDDIIQQRTELQQRLMHKNSNREWQRRVMPISTANYARGSGGMSNSGGVYNGARG
jgi:hypothetical protein